MKGFENYRTPPSVKFNCRVCGKESQSNHGRRRGVCGPHFLGKPLQWWNGFGGIRPAMERR